MSTTEDVFLTRPQLAKRWQMSEKTLTNWAAMRPRKGPKYIRLGGGHTRYRLADVVEFERAQEDT